MALIVPFDPSLIQAATNAGEAFSAHSPGGSEAYFIALLMVMLKAIPPISREIRAWIRIRRQRRRR